MVRQIFPEIVCIPYVWSDFHFVTKVCEQGLKDCDRPYAVFPSFEVYLETTKKVVEPNAFTPPKLVVCHVDHVNSLVKLAYEKGNSFLRNTQYKGIGSAIIVAGVPYFLPELLPHVPRFNFLGAVNVGIQIDADQIKNLAAAVAAAEQLGSGGVATPETFAQIMATGNYGDLGFISSVGGLDAFRRRVIDRTNRDVALMRNRRAEGANLGS